MQSVEYTKSKKIRESALSSNNVSVMYANACYTGGGIYCYHGKLSNGLYFLMADDWCENNDYVLIIDIEPNLDEAFFTEWQEKHGVGSLSGTVAAGIWTKVYEWLEANRPAGNYCIHELKQRMTKQ